MACGVALKRSLDFDVLRSSNSSVSCEDTITPPSSKRRKYSIAQRCGSVTSVTNTPPSVSPSVWQRYTPVTDATLTGAIEEKSPFTSPTKACAISSEQIVKHIYQEYRRMKKRKQLQAPPSPESSSNRLLAGSSSSPSASGHSSIGSNLPYITLDPRSTTSVVLPGRQNADTPLLSIKQVGLICERLLAEQEEKLRSEYERTLVNKLSEQYDAFVKFSHDQLHRQLQGRPASYVS